MGPRIVSLALALCACGRIGYERVTRATVDAHDVSSDHGGAAADLAERSADGPSPRTPDMAPPDPLDYCVTIPALRSPARIDGALEPGLALRPLTPLGWRNPEGEARPLPAGNTASYAMAWSAEGLYFFVRVQDPERIPPGPNDSDYCGDGLELYAEDDGVPQSATLPNYGIAGARQFTVAAPANDRDPVARASVYRAAFLGAWTSPRFGAFPLPGGYAIEAVVTAQDLGLPAWPLAAGRKVGFDLSVNVSVAQEPSGTGCVRRLGQYYLRTADLSLPGDDKHPHHNVLAFCTPTLAAP